METNYFTRQKVAIKMILNIRLKMAIHGNQSPGHLLVLARKPSDSTMKKEKFGLEKMVNQSPQLKISLRGKRWGDFFNNLDV